VSVAVTTIVRVPGGTVPDTLARQSAVAEWRSAGVTDRSSPSRASRDRILERHRDGGGVVLEREAAQVAAERERRRPRVDRLALGRNVDRLGERRDGLAVAAPDVVLPAYGDPRIARPEVAGAEGAVLRDGGPAGELPAARRDVRGAVAADVALAAPVHEQVRLRRGRRDTERDPEQMWSPARCCGMRDASYHEAPTRRTRSRERGPRSGAEPDRGHRVIYT
jgi:hypothetical protein